MMASPEKSNRSILSRGASKLLFTTSKPLSSPPVDPSRLPQASPMFPPPARIPPPPTRSVLRSSRDSPGSAIFRIGANFRSSFNSNDLPELTLEERELEDMLLNNPDIKDDLFSEFVVLLEGDLPTKLLYFLGAGEIFREEDKKEKTRKTRALVKLFFQSNMTKLSGIPPDVVNQVLDMNKEAIVKVQKLVALDLLAHPLTIKQLQVYRNQ